MRKYFTLFVILFIAVVAEAQWKVSTENIRFAIKNLGITVDGVFSGLDASINFDPDNLNNSKITAAVKVKTIKTGISMRDDHLISSDYFNAKLYPEIKLVSTSFTKISGNSYKGFFNLTIKKTTKNISFPFTFTQNGDKGTFSGTFTINRRDFGVGGSSLTMGDNVTVNITVGVVK